MADFEDTNMQTQTSDENSTPSENQAFQQPRLRKIKRPKNHNGPISDMPNSTTTPQTQSAPSGGLIRAADISANDASRYPNPSYMNHYEETPTQPAEDHYAYQTGFDSFIAQLNPKKFVGILILCFLFGLCFGKILFSSKQVVLNGLQDVVVNPEVPQGRSRCGVVEKTQGCVLYVMNPQRQELNGRDFYDLASQLTGRQRFVIETGNMRYSSMKIKPGNIAQLNIPPLQ